MGGSMRRIRFQTKSIQVFPKNISMQLIVFVVLVGVLLYILWLNQYIKIEAVAVFITFIAIITAILQQKNMHDAEELKHNSATIVRHVEWIRTIGDKLAEHTTTLSKNISHISIMFIEKEPQNNSNYINDNMMVFLDLTNNIESFVSILKENYSFLKKVQKQGVLPAEYCYSIPYVSDGKYVGYKTIENRVEIFIKNIENMIVTSNNLLIPLKIVTEGRYILEPGFYYEQITSTYDESEGVEIIDRIPYRHKMAEDKVVVKYNNVKLVESNLNLFLLMLLDFNKHMS